MQVHVVVGLRGEARGWVQPRRLSQPRDERQNRPAVPRLVRRDAGAERVRLVCTGCRWQLTAPQHEAHGKIRARLEPAVALTAGVQRSVGGPPLALEPLMTPARRGGSMTISVGARLSGPGRAVLVRLFWCCGRPLSACELRVARELSARVPYHSRPPWRPRGSASTAGSFGCRTGRRAACSSSSPTPTSAAAPHGDLLKQKLPGVNLLRLVVLHWNDHPRASGNNKWNDCAATRRRVRLRPLPESDRPGAALGGEERYWSILTARVDRRGRGRARRALAQLFEDAELRALFAGVARRRAALPEVRDGGGL